MSAEQPNRRVAVRLAGVFAAPAVAAAILVAFQAGAIAAGRGRFAFENLVSVGLFVTLGVAAAAAYLASTLPERLPSRVAAGMFALAYGFVATGPLYWLLKVTLQAAGVHVER